MFSGGSGGSLGSLGGLGSLGELGSSSGLGLGSLSLDPDPSGSQGLPSLSDLAKADQQTSGFDLDTNLLKVRKAINNNFTSSTHDQKLDYL